MEPPFSLPKDGEIFIDQVYHRCSQLIAAGIWHGIEQIKLDTWLKNFHSESEQYFAACILDGLIYRSEDQTVALMEQLFERVIPDLQRVRPPPVPVGHRNWHESLSDLLYPPPVRIVPVIKPNDPPTKSGPALARLYRRRLLFNQSWMIWPWQIDRCVQLGIKQFLFIDDFLGTGEQFFDFGEFFDLKTKLKGCYSIYAPLVAHVSGIAKINTDFPSVHVVSAECINDDYNIFSPKSERFKDGVNTVKSAKLCYDEITLRAKFSIKPEAMRGYGKLSLAYGFSHATPDNSLPILWSRGENWKPLLER